MAVQSLTPTRDIMTIYELAKKIGYVVFEEPTDLPPVGFYIRGAPPVPVGVDRLTPKRVLGVAGRYEYARVLTLGEDGLLHYRDNYTVSELAVAAVIGGLIRGKVALRVPELPMTPVPASFGGNRAEITKKTITVSVNRMGITYEFVLEDALSAQLLHDMTVSIWVLASYLANIPPAQPPPAEKVLKKFAEVKKVADLLNAPERVVAALFLPEALAKAPKNCVTDVGDDIAFCGVRFRDMLALFSPESRATLLAQALKNRHVNKLLEREVESVAPLLEKLGLTVLVTPAGDLKIGKGDFLNDVPRYVVSFLNSVSKPAPLKTLVKLALLAIALHYTISDLVITARTNNEDDISRWVIEVSIKTREPGLRAFYKLALRKHGCSKEGEKYVCSLNTFLGVTKILTRKQDNLEYLRRWARKDEGVIEEIVSEFLEWFNKNDNIRKGPISPVMKEIVYAVLMRRGSKRRRVRVKLTREMIAELSKLGRRTPYLKGWQGTVEALLCELSESIKEIYY